MILTYKLKAKIETSPWGRFIVGLLAYSEHHTTHSTDKNMKTFLCINKTKKKTKKPKKYNCQLKAKIETSPWGLFILGLLAYREHHTTDKNMKTFQNTYCLSVCLPVCPSVRPKRKGNPVLSMRNSRACCFS